MLGGLTVCLALIAVAPTPASAGLDEVVAGCPTADEIAAFQADFSFSIEPDTSPAAPCASAQTETQRRLFQTLQVFKSLSFVRPLPWTALAPYEWLKNAIDGIRIRADTEANFCCDPPGVINLAPSMVADPWDGERLLFVLRTTVHEARHREIGGHTCGGNDLTFDEQGAIAVEHWISQWIGLFGGAAMAASSPHQPSFYRELSLDRSLGNGICNAPVADLRVTTSAPAQVNSGGQLSYSTTLANNGPEAAPRTHLSHDPSPGLEFVSASTDLGPCLTPTQTGGGPAVCELGTLAVGGAVNALFTYRVTAPAGAVLGGVDRISVGAPRVTADIQDPNFANNAPPTTVLVEAGQPTVKLDGRARTKQRGRDLIVKPGVTLTCPSGGEVCTAVATVTPARGARSRPVGTARMQIAAGATKAVVFKLNRRGMQLLGNKASLRASLKLVTRAGEGESATHTKSFAIKPRR